MYISKQIVVLNGKTMAIITRCAWSPPSFANTFIVFDRTGQNNRDTTGMLEQFRQSLQRSTQKVQNNAERCLQNRLQGLHLYNMQKRKRLWRSHPLLSSKINYLRADRDTLLSFIVAKWGYDVEEIKRILRITFSESDLSPVFEKNCCNNQLSKGGASFLTPPNFQIHASKSLVVFSRVISIGLPPVLGSLRAPATMRSMSGFSTPNAVRFLGMFKDAFRSST